jgi:hypothetical protein
MKKFFLAALVPGVFTVNKKANTQHGFSSSDKTTPQFSFWQNKDDRELRLKYMLGWKIQDLFSCFGFEGFIQRGIFPPPFL